MLHNILNHIQYPLSVINDFACRVKFQSSEKNNIDKT